jgi:hypothetical protein
MAGLPPAVGIGQVRFAEGAAAEAETVLVGVDAFMGEEGMGRPVRVG